MKTGNERLPAHYARCVNILCPVRKECLRWLGRLDPHVASYFAGPSRENGCEVMIKRT